MLPSRAIRRAVRQFAEMPAWLKLACAAACAGFVVLASASGSWGILEWLRLVGTALCIVGALAVVLLLFKL